MLPLILLVMLTIRCLPTVAVITTTLATVSRPSILNVLTLVVPTWLVVIVVMCMVLTESRIVATGLMSLSGSLVSDDAPRAPGTDY